MRAPGKFILASVTAVAFSAASAFAAHVPAKAPMSGKPRRPSTTGVDGTGGYNVGVAVAQSRGLAGDPLC